MTRAIRKTDVPLFLREGERYQAMKREDSVVNVPQGCFANDLFLAQPADLKPVIATLNYWKVRAIPVEVKDFAMHEVELHQIHEFAVPRRGGDSLLQEFLCELVVQRRSVSRSPYIAAWKYTADARTAAARAAQYCWYVHYHIEQGQTFRICRAAAWADDVEALKVLVQLGFPTERVVLSAFSCLQSVLYLRDAGVACGPELCQLAAMQKNLAALKALHQNGFPWDVRTCRAAAEVDALDCLAYAHEHRCPGDATVFRAAAQHGSRHCLTYLRENACPWDEETSGAAASNGQADSLRYLLQDRCPRPPHLCTLAASSGNIRTVRCAREFACPWDESTTVAARKFFPVLKYLVKAGCPFSPWNTFIYAHSFNEPEVIWYLTELGMKWKEEHSEVALMVGHVDVITALYAAGCPFGKEALATAARRGGYELFTVLHQQGAVLDRKVWRLCREAADPRLLQFAAENGCPRSADYDPYDLAMPTMAFLLASFLLYMAIFHQEF